MNKKEMKFVPFKLGHALYKYDQVLVPYYSLYSKFYLKYVKINLYKIFNIIITKLK